MIKTKELDVASLIERQSNLLDEAEGLLGAPQGANEEGEKTGALSEEQQSRYDAIQTELGTLNDSINLRKKAVEQREQQRNLQEWSKRTVTPAPASHSTQGTVSSKEQKQLNKFRLGRALCMAYHNRWEGFEKEMIEEGAREARKSGISIKDNGFIVSGLALGSHKIKRDLSVADDPELVSEDQRGTIMGGLFDAPTVRQMGATVYPNLTGDLPLPRFEAGSPSLHKAENATADGYVIGTDTLVLTPKRLPSYTKVSDKMFAQYMYDNLETEVTNELEGSMVELMDYAFIDGAGGLGPTGILRATGLGAVPGGPDGDALSWSDFVQAKRVVRNAKANRGRLGYLINPDVEAAAETTSKDAGSGRMIIEEAGAGRIGGYPYMVTNGVPNDGTKGSGTDLSALIYGDFSAYAIGQWTGIEFLINRYKEPEDGWVWIHATVFYDGGPRRPHAFAAKTDIVTP